MEKRSKSFQFALSAMIIAALLAMPFTTNAQAGKANFAGNWAFNAQQSNMGQPAGGGAPGGGAPGGGQGGGQRMGGFGGGDFVAKQEANLLTVERTRTTQDGQTMTTTEKYTLDGKETVNTTQRGESKSTATWSADGKTLTVVTTRDFNGNTMKTTAVWTLKDANTLSVTTKMPGMDGNERTTTAVYNKK